MKRFLIGASAVLAICTSGAASAQQPEPGRGYLGVGFSLTNVDYGALLDPSADELEAAVRDAADASSATLDTVKIEDNATLQAVSLLSGYDFHQYFGVEVEGLFGIGDENLVDISGTVDGAPFGARATAELEYSLAAFGKLQYPVSEEFTVFARAGYARFGINSRAKLDDGSVIEEIDFDEETEGFAFGVGGEWRFSGPNAVRVDYTRYELEDLDELNVDRVSIAYIRRF
ncbi:outer membrane beta-barrel protein [Marinicauda salina]|nr:outer membrane beta-barrel protein [Marinicauda salina]